MFLHEVLNARVKSALRERKEREEKRREREKGGMAYFKEEGVTAEPSRPNSLLISFLESSPSFRMPFLKASHSSPAVGGVA